MARGVGRRSSVLNVQLLSILCLSFFCDIFLTRRLDTWPRGRKFTGNHRATRIHEGQVQGRRRFRCCMHEVAWHSSDSRNAPCHDRPWRWCSHGDIYGQGLDWKNELYARACCAPESFQRLLTMLISHLSRSVYETVKKKEVEKRRDAAATASATNEPRFADVLKEQWEKRKAELEAERVAAAKSSS